MTTLRSVPLREHDLIVRVPDGAPPAVAFAAGELASYITRLTGVRVVARNDPALGGNYLLVLDCAPGEAPGAAVSPSSREPMGFSIRSDGRGVVMTGNNARAVLDAVYTLLAWWGCRWSPHGAVDERVPRLEDLPLPDEPIDVKPRFTTTGYAADLMTWHVSEPTLYRDRLAEDQTLIDWMGKTGANRFLYIRHPVDDLLTVADLQGEMDRRGIAVDFGGHVIPALVPRDLFASHPEYFPVGPDGVRSSNGNICTAQLGALETAQRTAVTWVRTHPGVVGFHIWGADLWRGGWCNCAECAHVSVQDQSLRLCNAVARGLAAAGMPRPVYYLAYHDTIDPAGDVAPDPMVWVEFAPRERCYGHALDDARCKTNRRYAAALEGYANRFGGRVRIFEYYGDAILFCGCAVPLTEVIEADLAYFARLGVPEITMLQFGAASRFAYPINFAAFASAALGAGAVGAATASYCRRFGARSAAVAAAMAEVETALGRVVRYGDVRRPPRSPRALAKVRSSVVAAIAVLDRVTATLSSVPETSVGDLREILAYTREVLEGVGAQCEGPKGVARAAARYLAAAEQTRRWSRQTAGVWGTVDLPRLHECYDVIFPQR